jgi:hypothetical protein
MNGNGKISDEQLYNVVKSISIPNYKLPRVSSIEDAKAEVGGWNGAIFYGNKLTYYNNNGYFDHEVNDKYRIVISFSETTEPTISADSIVYDFGSFIIVYKMSDRKNLKSVITVLTPTELEFRVISNGEIVFNEETQSLYIIQNGKIWAEIPKPSNCVDANGNPVDVEYAYDYSTQTLSLIVDANSEQYPITIDPTIVDGDGQGLSFPTMFGNRIARDSSGNIYVCWDEYINGSHSIIYMNVYNSSLGLVHDHLKLVASPAYGGGIVDTQPDAIFGSILIDSFDKMHFIYWQELFFGLNRLYRYSKCVNLANINQSSSWYIANETSNGSELIADYIYGWGNLCVDSSQRIYFAYGLYDGSDGNFKIKARMHNGPGAGNVWSSPVTIRTLSPDAYEPWACIDIDSSGYLHVIGIDRGISGEYYVVYYKSSNPYSISSWTGGTTILYVSDAIRGHAFGNIRCFATNKIMVTAILWSEPSPHDNYLLYNYYNGTSWTQGTGTPSGTTVAMVDGYGQGCFSNLTVDGMNNCYIAYQKRDDHNIYYRKWAYTTESWGSETLLLAQSTQAICSTGMERYLRPTDTKAYVLVWDTDAEPDVLYLYDFTVESYTPSLKRYNSTIAFM